MKVTFDPKKREATLSERGLDFADAEMVFSGRTATTEDKRRDYGERRLQTVGFFQDRMVMVVWTQRADARHIISMRKCNEKEQARHWQRFAEG